MLEEEAICKVIDESKRVILIFDGAVKNIFRHFFL